MKIIIITNVFLLFFCCKKTSIDQKTVLYRLPYSSYEESPLHPDLLKAWNMYKEHGMGGIIDSTICYFMGFHSYMGDSSLGVFFYDCDYKEKYTGCKGMTNIDGFYVAVLDPENIGKDFYNSKLLIQKDISELKCGKSECVKGMIIDGDSMEYIGCNLAFSIKNNKIEFGRGCLNNDIP